MSECVRKMTVEEEIRALRSVGVEQGTIDRILNKIYDDNACTMEREYRYRKELEDKVAEKDIIIKGLAGYIKLKGI